MHNKSSTNTKDPLTYISSNGVDNNSDTNTKNLRTHTNNVIGSGDTRSR